ncbi:hypothetical protein M9H77_26793 [Catharanthus roseus]|uniref:Uncharacterized protein n=1 Tax=Catharanthus roseus TaxID=4058 RepID=A0ACC0AAX5_CATRO|nr:hypothetical protein M9H77_26793 [Catharanthus roseus]
MDVLSDTELFEGSPHLVLEGRHGVSRGLILAREVIGLIVLTLLVIRLRGGCSYAGVAAVIKWSKCDDLHVATCVAHHVFHKGNNRKRVLIMDFIKHVHFNNADFTLEGTGKKGTKVTPVEYTTVVQQTFPYTKM